MEEDDVKKCNPHALFVLRNGVGNREGVILFYAKYLDE